MKRLRLIIYLFIVLFMIASSSCNGCPTGTKIMSPTGSLKITPKTGYSTALWKSYNAEQCGKKWGEAVGGYDGEWYQIKENDFNSLMIYVLTFQKEENEEWTGWVYCSDVTFTDALETYKDKLTVEQYELLDQCIEVSNK